MFGEGVGVGGAGGEDFSGAFEFVGEILGIVDAGFQFSGNHWQFPDIRRPFPGKRQPLPVREALVCAARSG